MFIINPSNCFTGTYLKPPQHKNEQFAALSRSTDVTKNFMLGSLSRGSLRTAPGTLGNSKTFADVQIK